MVDNSIVSNPFTRGPLTQADRCPYLGLDTAGRLESTALSLGRGCRASALSPAGARRVRGLLLGFASSDHPLPQRLDHPSLGKAARVLRNPVRHGRRLANPGLERPGGSTRATPRFELRLGCAALGVPQGQGERRTGCEGLADGNRRAWEGKKPLTRPATAGESAVAGHPLPRERAGGGA